MIDVEKIRKSFIKYAKKFDLKDKAIMRKFHHSFRVMEYSIEIAKSLNLKEEDVKLAQTIGLLHDISRFEQWTNYKTYSDEDSYDHGNRAFELLRDEDFICDLDKEEKEIILVAVKNHNKYEIEKNISEKALLMANIIRDADKLDIMKEQGNTLTQEILNLNDECINCFKEERIFNNKYAKQEADHIFRMLSFIYDINFKYSYEFILENKIVENKIHLLQTYSKETEILEEIKNQLLKYINDKLQGGILC